MKDIQVQLLRAGSIFSWGFDFSILEQTFEGRRLQQESQRTVLEVILTDSWKDIKRSCTAVLEDGGFKGLKIRVGNALHGTRTSVGEIWYRTDSLSPVLNMYSGVILHLLSLPSIFEDVSVNLFSAFMFSHFVWYSGFAFVSDSNWIRHMLGGPGFRRIQ